VKGAVLGKVVHFFWKKEYQARGAPHYHILLWIDGAPVIGQHSEEVLSWIQKKITCQMLDEKASPELYPLVTKYQLHKCSAYYKRKKKCGTAYLTTCRFGFPRDVTDEIHLNAMEESLKSKKKIYHLNRAKGQ